MSRPSKKPQLWWRRYAPVGDQIWSWLPLLRFSVPNRKRIFKKKIFVVVLKQLVKNKSCLKSNEFCFAVLLHIRVPGSDMFTLSSDDGVIALKSELSVSICNLWTRHYIWSWSSMCGRRGCSDTRPQPMRLDCSLFESILSQRLSCELLNWFSRFRWSTWSPGIRVVWPRSTYIFLGCNSQ